LIHDLDGDGSLETAIASGTNSGQAAIYIFEEASSTNTNSAGLPWPMIQRDPAHTALFLPPRLGFSTNELRIYHQTGSGTLAAISGSVQNIGGEEFNWTLNTNDTGGTVTANKASGTSLTANESVSIQFSISTASYAQNKWYHIGNIVITATNNGEPVNGSPKMVPVWLYVGDVTQVYLPFVIR
jgi:hypothetical protein